MLKLVKLDIISLMHCFKSIKSVFKGNCVGSWKQYKNTMSNLNIFSTMMSVEDMVKKTNGKECSTPGTYLRLIFI